MRIKGTAAGAGVSRNNITLTDLLTDGQAGTNGIGTITSTTIVIPDTAIADTTTEYQILYIEIEPTITNGYLEFVIQCTSDGNAQDNAIVGVGYGDNVASYNTGSVRAACGIQRIASASNPRMPKILSGHGFDVATAGSTGARLTAIVGGGEISGVTVTALDSTGKGLQQDASEAAAVIGAIPGTFYLIVFVGREALGAEITATIDQLWWAEHPQPTT